jgi:hypothetical protein
LNTRKKRPFGGHVISKPRSSPASTVAEVVNINNNGVFNPDDEM